ncbi:MAG TPA: hypothetical protein VEU29_01930 [Actinomycetota bacterium]|nr:hypothetical protein [Actinomycetota bacterium]
MTEQNERQEQQRRAELSDAVKFTERLRSSDEVGWTGIRQRLEAEGVSPDDAAVATLFPDDTNLLYGVILTRDDRCFWFTFEYSATEPWELLEWGSVSSKLRRAYEKDLPYARTIMDGDTG